MCLQLKAQTRFFSVANVSNRSDLRFVKENQDKLMKELSDAQADFTGSIDRMVRAILGSRILEVVLVLM